jgi:hypothetical protein
MYNYKKRRKLKICLTCWILQYHYSWSKECKECNNLIKTERLNTQFNLQNKKI